ncbi:MAG TPA: SEC-C metal-binding domain-containing protein, partial [Ktedonobacteraceae bacterium]|nr:SEC-C metal-binding domain-containing protein [Ktedonobacteraceae bacterium]
TTEAKYNAVVEEIKALHETGIPVLVGTTSVENSEYISEKLDKQGIPHNVLNAKHHAREAQIVAQAGRSGTVTIATNMAGRGTDIVLGGNPEGYLDSILRKHAEQVNYIREMPESDEDERAEKEEAIQQYLDNMTEAEKDELLQRKVRECEEDHNHVVELGGLHIIGTERHESRRIDNQLRGRAGRQGDPGQSRFFLALDDELMRRFAADRVGKVMEMVGMEEDMPLESSMVSRFIEQAQTKVEGYNFDIRKNVVDYDDVIAKQREVIYADRLAVLERADMHERVLGMMRAEVNRLVDACIPGSMVTEEEQLERLLTLVETWVQVPEDVLPENIHAVRREELRNKLIDLVIDHYEEQGEKLDELAEQNPGLNVPTIRDIERSFTLQIVDRLWMDHIDALDVMRASIHFRSVGQRDPLVEFKNEAFRMFEELKLAIQRYIVDELLKLVRGEISLRVQQPEPKRKMPRKVRTNVDELARASGQAKSDGDERPKAVTGRRNASSGARSNGRTNGRSEGRSPAANQTTRPTMPGRIGRNDPCPCGSGKKYKKCHGA